MGDRRPVCEECGYDLTGVGGPSLVRCPECGLEWSTQRPFLIAPMPAWWMVLWRCWWPAGVLTSGVSAAVVTGLGWLVPFVFVPVLIGWVMAAVAVPAMVARDVAQRCVLRPSRRRARVAILLVGVGGNVALSVVVPTMVAAVWG